MSDNPVFVYAAVYTDRADADADYDTLLDAHSADLVGTYDVALVYKDDEGKVHVTKQIAPRRCESRLGSLAIECSRKRLAVGLLAVCARPDRARVHRRGRGRSL